MSILDKHPAPWRGWDDKYNFTIVDANGVEVFPMELIIGREAPDELKRLILAAPELLAALKELVELSPPFGRKFIVKVDGKLVERDDPTFKAAKLIARIEGGK